MFQSSRTRAGPGGSIDAWSFQNVAPVWFRWSCASVFALTADIIARARPLFLFWGISEAFELVRKGLIEIEIEVSEARARHGREDWHLRVHGS